MDRGEDFSKGFGKALTVVKDPAITSADAKRNSAAVACMVDWLNDVV